MSKEERIYSHYKSKVHLYFPSEWEYELDPSSADFDEDAVILELAQVHKMKCREVKDIIRARQQANKPNYIKDRFLKGLRLLEAHLDGGHGSKYVKEVLRRVQDDDIVGGFSYWFKHKSKVYGALKDLTWAKHLALTDDIEYALLWFKHEHNLTENVS